MYTYQTHDQTSVSVLLVMGELISWEHKINAPKNLIKYNLIKYNKSS
ncbi:hypothetical protein AO373_0758 [Moraxella catarrhalis]|uniref:Uncharacterized protein n=1 Tax=Moraxella catarrhalis TaxID=480 RepID=A0AB36DMB4_MORCA|nr:hypothetical protein AO373_0758 [Moraxella catarrhalis]OAV22865.1 hypothetical protein AO370_1875 [Moraxella catarrhalis]